MGSSLNSVSSLTNQLVNGGCILTTIRNRYNFPRPNEVHRIRKHGYKTRMSTLSGRKIIMRRYLKGRHVLSH